MVQLVERKMTQPDINEKVLFGEILNLLIMFNVAKENKKGQGLLSCYNTIVSSGTIDSWYVSVGHCILLSFNVQSSYFSGNVLH